MNYMYQGGNKGLTPAQIVSIMRTEYRITASYWKCWKAQSAAQNIMRGTPEDNYATLPSYLYMLQEVNPGTVIKLELDASHHFKYMFIAFGQSIRGYQVMKNVTI